jgi:hypothetical protein
MISHNAIYHERGIKDKTETKYNLNAKAKKLSVLSIKVSRERSLKLPYKRNASHHSALSGYFSNCQRQLCWHSHQHNMLHLFAPVSRLALSANMNSIQLAVNRFHLVLPGLL